VPARAFGRLFSTPFRSINGTCLGLNGGRAAPRGKVAGEIFLRRRVSTSSWKPNKRPRVGTLSWIKRPFGTRRTASSDLDFRAIRRPTHIRSRGGFLLVFPQPRASWIDLKRHAYALGGGGPGCCGGGCQSAGLFGSLALFQSGSSWHPWHKARRFGLACGAWDGKRPVPLRPWAVARAKGQDRASRGRLLVAAAASVAASEVID